MIFSVIILTVLGSLQFLFLDSFYHSMKLSEIKRIGDRLASQFHSTDFDEVMNDYAFRNNLRVILLDESGRMEGNFDGFSTDPMDSEDPLDMPGMRPPQANGMFPQNDFAMVLQRLAQSDSDHIAYMNTDERRDATQAIYVARVSDTNGQTYYLYISSPLPEIDSTISVLRTQFIIITIILLGLSLVAAQLISKKMSKPMIQLTKSAERLVKGDLSETFYEDGFTEIHQLASAMNYAAGELRSLDNYRKEFIANVSHDLKTPLTIIKFYSEMIKEVSGNDPEKRNAHCDIIIREVDWLTGMVGEILELSKLEASNAEVAITEVDLSACLTDVFTSFQVLAEKDGYSFEADIETDLRVQGNEPMLRRVLYNLISNAVNFTGADKVVRLLLKDVGNHIRFEVTDTGVGIPKEKQNAIWDRYYKSGDTHKRAVVGTGLGLSIVKNALTLLGAEYGVISELGKGSTFWFELNKAS